MPKKKARAKDERIITKQKSRRLYIGILAGVPLILCFAGIMLPWQPSTRSENPRAVLAPDPPPTPLPLAKEYIYAGSKLIATEEPTPAAAMDDASFVTQQVPTTMIVGQSYNLSLTFQNTGSNHWDTVSYQLGSQNPQDNTTWGLSRVVLPQTTSSQAQVTFSFAVTAPSTPGTYSFQWKMIKNNSSWFGTASTTVSINVFVASLNSISVNGTTAYAAVANSTSINITGPITVEAWIKLNSITGIYQTIVGRHSWQQVGTGGGYELTITNIGKPRLDLYQSHNQYTTLIGATTVTTGVWHHIAGVFDGSYMKIYLDGVLDGSQTNGNGPASGTSVLNIGRNPYPSQYFGGLIDEVRVSAGAIYTSNFSPATSLSAAGSTRALWKFDNQTLSDSSGNNNTCSLNGNASFSPDVPVAPTLNSISVNGTTAYAAVANSTSINITGPITVEAWIKLNSITGIYQTIVGRHSWQQVGTGGGYELTITNIGKPRLDLYQSHNQYTTLIGTTTVTTGVWHHIAGVFDGSYMKIYLDGVLDGSQTNGNGPASGTSVLNIGRNPYPSQYFGGLIDEVRVSAAAIYTSNFTPATSLSAAGSTRALWKFDNQTLSDSSGNNNTCSLNGNATFSPDVPVAPTLNSISMNGTTAYAAVANSTSINITGPITVEAWIKLNSITGSYQTIVARHSWQQVGTGGGYELTITNIGKPRLDLYQSHNQYTTLIGATTVTTGVWHHIAGVFDGSYMKIYLDGVLDGSQTNGNGPASGTSVLNIGRNPYPSQYFGGLIDEVRVSAAAIYTSNFTPATSLSAAGGTRALWKFDNQTLSDSSGNNNTCSLNGNASFSAAVP